jgi:hypothetical protein
LTHTNAIVTATARQKQLAHDHIQQWLKHHALLNIAASFVGQLVYGITESL